MASISAGTLIPTGSRLMRRIWMRGFFPAVFFGVLWVFSTASWILWFGSGPTQPRALLGRGIAGFNWNSTGTWRGVGQSRWKVGNWLTKKGVPVTWHVSMSGWSPSNFRVQWLPVIIPGTVQIPLWIPMAICLVPPIGFAWVRARRRPEWACAACGYDLRASPGDLCPECGQRRMGKDSPRQ
jgi:DNA-directed RNA polymerase subunit RPC12/RpoP